jgi:hypothetical protein
MQTPKTGTKVRVVLFRNIAHRTTLSQVVTGLRCTACVALWKTEGVFRLCIVWRQTKKKVRGQVFSLCYYYYALYPRIRGVGGAGDAVWRC